MTNEKRYQIICEMLHAFDLQTGIKHADDVIRNPKFWNIPDALETGNFYQNAAALLIETLETMDKKTGTDRAIVAALNRVIRRDRKEYSNSYDGVFETLNEYGEKRYIITDRRLLIRLKDDYPSLRRATGNTPNSETINRIIKGTVRDGEKLDLPTIPELKTFIAGNKAKFKKSYTPDKIPYCLENLYFDAERLLDVMQALPGCDAFKPANNETPIYFSADNGDGVLMQLNPRWAERQKAATTAA